MPPWQWLPPELHLRIAELVPDDHRDRAALCLAIPSLGLAASKGDARQVRQLLGERADPNSICNGASALQLADQYIYDNNFIYFQPGSGKVLIKEPKAQLKIAAKKLDEILATP